MADQTVARKPLSKVVSEGRRQPMVHHPTRWPLAVWERFVARAAAKRVPVADIVRECGIAGLGYIETEEAMREHRRATL